jgi:choice-of-anchor C domain-containing protein
MKIDRLAVLALALISAPTALGAGFTNGSFEGSGFVDTLPFEPGFMTISAGSTTIPGWTVGNSNNIDWLTTWVSPFDGTKSVDLNGTAPGSIQQTFDTTPGQIYLVQFALAGNIVDSPALKVGRVSAAGQSMQFQFNTTGHSTASPGWVETDFNFTANSASSTLLFESLTLNSAGGAIIDDVRVSAVPEPATLSLLSFVGVLRLRRSKRI